MSPPRDPWRLRGALLSIQLFYGIHYVVAKWIVTEMEPAAWAALRALAAFLIVGGIALVLRRRLPRGRDLAWLALCSVFGVILNQALFLEGIARTTPAHAALINSQIPSFALFWALVSRQERLGARKLAAFLLGMAGVMVLLELDHLQLGGATLTGDLLCLANASSFGLFIVMSRRVMERVDPLAATTVVFGGGLLGLGIYGADELLAADLGALSGRAVGGMLFAVLAATVGTYFLNLWALKRVKASRVALFIFLQPLVAAALSVAFLGEVLTGRIFLASVLVFLALFFRKDPA